MDYIFYFGITIGILVFVHELGHFLAAKICKMRVNVFAIGFGKRLFGYNKINGFTFGNLPEDMELEGNTDYRISLIPLGGYVKIVGMVDESMDTEFAKHDPQPWEFRAKPTIHKLFVISAGVLMNLLLAVLIFWGVNYTQGKPLWNTTTIGNITETSIAAKAGFSSNDKIISINNQKVNNWQSVIEGVFTSSVNSKTLIFKVNRENEIKEIPVSSKTAQDTKTGFFLAPAYTSVFINQVMKNSPAETAGIKEGDIFKAINGVELKNSEDAKTMISANGSKEIIIDIKRKNKIIEIKAVPDLNGKLGIALGELYSGPITYYNYGFIEALGLSVSNIYNYTFLTFATVKNIFKGDVKFDQAFGGPVKIAQFAAKSADNGIIPFLMFLAMLSLSLAIINMLPLPAIDGGHFVIILIEGIIKREIPLKAKIIIQNVGLVLILTLMAFIIYSDILSVF